MRLHVLGSSGTWPTPGRPASGYVVSHEGTRIWVDAGPGTFMALAGLMVPGELDAVVISHVHPDHCSDFFALLHYLAYGPGGSVPVPVYVPAGAAEHLASFVRADDDGSRFSHVFTMHTVGEGDEVDVGAVHVRFAEASHSVPALAVRFDAGGASLAYSGDTGPGGGLPALATGVKLLLCEAAYQGNRGEHPYPFHLTAGEAGALARASGATRLMLTHVQPALDLSVSVAEAEAEFGRAVEVAVPGMEVVV